MRRLDGQWRNATGLISREDHPELFARLYDPYTRLLSETEARLAPFGFDAEAPQRDRLGPAA